MEPVGVTESVETRYYNGTKQAHDDLLRCAECQRLVLYSLLCKLGSCICGCKRSKEITTLTEEEMAKIQSGEIDFPYRQAFLAEFSPIDV